MTVKSKCQFPCVRGCFGDCLHNSSVRSTSAGQCFLYAGDALAWDEAHRVDQCWSALCPVSQLCCLGGQDFPAEKVSILLTVHWRVGLNSPFCWLTLYWIFCYENLETFPSLTLLYIVSIHTVVIGVMGIASYGNSAALETIHIHKPLKAHAHLDSHLLSRGCTLINWVLSVVEMVNRTTIVSLILLVSWDSSLAFVYAPHERL